MKTLWHHIELLRPLNLLTAALAMVVCASIMDGLHETKILLVTIFGGVCYNAGANAYNDVMDYKTDVVNRPRRPLVTGQVKIKMARAIAIILFVIGSVLTLELSKSAQFIAIGLALPTLIIYSKFLKGTPLIGNAVVAIILGLAFIFSGAAFGQIETMIIPSCLAFGLTFLREFVKDMADIEGDSKAGLNTFPAKVGLEKSEKFAIVSALIIGAGALFPYLNGYYDIPYLVVLVLGVEIPLLMIVFSFLKSPEIDQAKRFSEVLKFSTIIGLMAFFVDNYVR